MITTMKKSKINKVLITLFLALTLIGASFIGYKLNSFEPTDVYASKVEQTMLSNSNFYTSSTGLITPSGWTSVDPNGIKDSITHGVINVKSSNFIDDKNDTYSLQENPGIPSLNEPTSSTSPLYNHLMINTKKKVESSFTDTPTRFGYSANLTQSLTKNSYYSISVTLKTTGDARASVYLLGLSDQASSANFENVKTSNTWQTYTLYVSTNNFANETGLSLQLWLGEKNTYGQNYSGAVFFSSVKINKYSEKEFTEELYFARTYNNYADNVKSIELNAQIDDALQITNNSFEASNSELIGFEVLQSYAGTGILKARPVPTNNYNATTHTSEGIVNPLTNGKTGNNNVLFMQNTSETAYQGIRSSEIIISQYKYYKLTIWANSAANVGTGATLRLIEKENKDNVGNLQTSTLSVATTKTSNASTNNWSEYSFYVQGHALKDVTIYLELLLGTSEKPTQGYVFFDDITIQEITYNNFQKGSSGSNNATFNLSSNNTEFLNANGNFNVTNGLSGDYSSVYVPKDWTYSASEDYSFALNGSGIVNTDPDRFTDFADEFSLVQNPGLTPLLQSVGSTNLNNNVLAIHNQATGTQKYTNTSITLNANSYYKVTFSVYTTTNASYNGGVTFTLNNSSTSKVFELKNINTLYTWKEYTLYLKTGSNSISGQIELALENTSGFAFFDNVNIITSSEQIFTSAMQNTNSQNFALDLSAESFEQYSYNTNKSLNTAFNWTTDSGFSSVKTGIINTNLLPDFLTLGNISNPNPAYGSNVLFIGSTSEDVFVKLTSTNTFTLNTNTNYKITVRVKTTNIGQEEVNKQYTEENEVIPFGASVKLTAFENMFSSIDTSQIEDNYNNDWVEYTFYITPNATTSTAVEISLGSESALTSGQVFVDKIEISQLEAEEFATQTANIENSQTALNLTEVKPETETPQEEPDKDSGFEANKFDGMLLSSLILFAAIVVAIIGVMVRKIDFKRAPKVKTTYDRRKTLAVEMDRREKLAIRKAELEELNNEISNLDKETETLLQKVKQEKAKELENIENKKLLISEKQKEIKENINNLTKEFEEQQLSLTDEKAKEVSKNKFNKGIKALNKQTYKLELSKISKTLKLKELEETENEILNKQNYRKNLINQEIKKFEEEIKLYSQNKSTARKVNKITSAELEPVEISESETNLVEKENIIEIEPENTSDNSNNNSESENN